MDSNYDLEFTFSRDDLEDFGLAIERTGDEITGLWVRYFSAKPAVQKAIESVRRYLNSIKGVDPQTLTFIEHIQDVISGNQDLRTEPQSFCFLTSPHEKMVFQNPKTKEFIEYIEDGMGCNCPPVPRGLEQGEGEAFLPGVLRLDLTNISAVLFNSFTLSLGQSNRKKAEEYKRYAQEIGRAACRERLGSSAEKGFAPATAFTMQAVLQRLNEKHI